MKLVGCAAWVLIACGGTPLIRGGDRPDFDDERRGLGEVRDGVGPVEISPVDIPPGWTQPIAAEADAGEGLSMAPKARAFLDGSVLVVWQRRDENSPQHKLLSNLYEPNVGWRGESVIHASTSGFGTVKIAVGGLQQAVVIALNNADGMPVVLGATMGGAGWSTMQAINAPQAAVYPDLPRVAMNAHGDALVVWRQVEYGDAGTQMTLHRRAFYQHDWQSAPDPLPVGSAYSHGPQLTVALNGAGDSAVAWFELDDNYEDFSVWLSRGPLTSGFSGLRPVQTVIGGGYAIGPFISLRPAGDVAVFWGRQEDPDDYQHLKLLMSVKNPSADYWTTATVVSGIRAAGVSESFISGATSPNGNLGLMWWDSDYQSASLRTARYTAAGGFEAPVTLRAGLAPVFVGCGPFENAEAAVAIADDGSTLVVYEEMVDLEDGSFRFDVWAMDGSPTGDWSEPRQLNEVGTHATAPDVSFGPAGIGAAVWTHASEAWASDVETAASLFGGR